MGIQERKKRHINELRSRILAEAEQLFVEEGYQNVSMRKIAARIEYSPTTIYRLFESKAVIMRLLIADGYRRVYEQYQRILAEPSGSALQTLASVVRTYVDFALDNPNHYSLWFATSELEVVENRLQMRHGESKYRVYQTWLDLIEECKSEGVFVGTDTLSAFQLVWGAVHGLIALRIQHPRFPWMPREQHIDQLLSMIELGLARAPGSEGGSSA